MQVIYLLTNNITKKHYIGQTNDIKRRLRRHKNDGRICDTYLHKSIRKYGWKNFSYEILTECSDRKDLNEKETYYIEMYNSKAPNGYNMTLGGEGHNGLSPSLETREKISKANTGIERTKECREKLSISFKNRYKKENHPNWGKHLSKETREKISSSNKGRKLSEESKNNVREGLKKRERNVYIITSPNGEINETTFLKKFCEEHKLVYSCMIKVARNERKHHKGYKIKRYENTHKTDHSTNCNKFI